MPHFPTVAAAEVNARESDPSVTVSITFSALSYTFKILLCLNLLKSPRTWTVLWVGDQLLQVLAYPSAHLLQAVCRCLRELV